MIRSVRFAAGLCAALAIAAGAHAQSCSQSTSTNNSNVTATWGSSATQVSVCSSCSTNCPSRIKPRYRPSGGGADKSLSTQTVSLPGTPTNTWAKPGDFASIAGVDYESSRLVEVCSLYSAETRKIHVLAYNPNPEPVVCQATLSQGKYPVLGRIAIAKEDSSSRTFELDFLEPGTVVTCPIVGSGGEPGGKTGGKTGTKGGKP